MLSSINDSLYIIIIFLMKELPKLVICASDIRFQLRQRMLTLLTQCLSLTTNVKHIA